MRVRSMPAWPASRRASGVTVAPVARRAGPQLRSGVRTSRNGSRMMGADVAVTWTGETSGAEGDSARAERLPPPLAGGGGGGGAGPVWDAAPEFAAPPVPPLQLSPASGGESRCPPALPSPPAPATIATTAPTGATSPAATRISVSVPADVAGTSIDTLSVSISNRLSPGLTASPIDLNQVVILPSATVSPSCGIRMSMSALSLSLSPTHRHVLRLHELHHALVSAFAADAALLGAAERCGGIGDEPAVEPDHAEVELFRHPQPTAQVLGVEIGDEAVFGVVGAR